MTAATDGTAANVAQVRSLIAEARQNLGGAIAGLKSAVADLPLVGGAATHALDTAAMHVNRTLDDLDLYVAAPGVPFSLEATGAAWGEGVHMAISEVHGDLFPEKLSTALAWKGAAADAYRTTFLSQREAINNLKTTCTEINTALRGLASAVDVYWGAVVVALGAFVAALIVAIASAGVLAIPAFIAAVVILGSAFLYAKINFSVSLESAKVSMQNRTADWSGLTDRKWPMSTRVTSDASFADGSSDWHLRE